MIIEIQVSQLVPMQRCGSACYDPYQQEKTCLLQQRCNCCAQTSCLLHFSPGRARAPSAQDPSPIPCDLRNSYSCNGGDNSVRVLPAGR